MIKAALYSFIGLTLCLPSLTAREWTLKKGSKFEADFVELKDIYTVVLKNKVGKTVDLTLDKLHIEDIWWIRRKLNTTRTSVVPYGWCYLQPGHSKHRGKSIAIGVQRKIAKDRNYDSFNVFEHNGQKHQIVRKSGQSLIPGLYDGSMLPSYPEGVKKIGLLQHKAKTFQNNLYDVTQHETRIEVGLLTGKVNFIYKGKIIKSTTVSDKDYIEAVNNGDLEEICGNSRFRPDRNGNYKIPIVFSEYRLISSEGKNVKNEKLL